MQRNHAKTPSVLPRKLPFLGHGNPTYNIVQHHLQNPQLLQIKKKNSKKKKIIFLIHSNFLLQFHNKNIFSSKERIRKMLVDIICK